MLVETDAVERADRIHTRARTHQTGHTAADAEAHDADLAAAELLGAQPVGSRRAVLDALVEIEAAHELDRLLALGLVLAVTELDVALEAPEHVGHHTRKARAREVIGDIAHRGSDP